MGFTLLITLSIIYKKGMEKNMDQSKIGKSIGEIRKEKHGERLIKKKNSDSIEIEIKLEIEEEQYNSLFNYFSKENNKHINKKQHDIYF